MGCVDWFIWQTKVLYWMTNKIDCGVTWFNGPWTDFWWQMKLTVWDDWSDRDWTAVPGNKWCGLIWSDKHWTIIPGDKWHGLIWSNKHWTIIRDDKWHWLIWSNREWFVPLEHIWDGTVWKGLKWVLKNSLAYSVFCFVWCLQSCLQPPRNDVFHSCISILCT